MSRGGRKVVCMKLGAPSGFGVLQADCAEECAFSLTLRHCTYAYL